eukprot:EG_transcript_22924
METLLGVLKVTGQQPTQQTTSAGKTKAASTAVSTPSAETARGATNTLARNMAENPDESDMEAAAAMVRDIVRTTRKRIAQAFGKSESEVAAAIKETLQTVQERFPQQLEKPNNVTPLDEVERLLRGLERLERLLKAAPPDRVAGLRSRLRALSGSLYTDLAEYNLRKAHLKEPHPLMERLRGAMERLGGLWSTGNRPAPLQTPVPEEVSKDEDKGDKPDAEVEQMLSMMARLEGALKDTPQEK